MLKNFNTALIAALSSVDGLTARQYRGELGNPEGAKALARELPLVMVDFVGDDHAGHALKKTAVFNLYIVHVSFSGNDTAREGKRWELVDLVEEIDERITAKSFAGSQPVKLQKLQKLFDGQAGGGYLTAFMRTLHVELRK